MTNKEFFIKTVAAEAKVFIKVLKAVPADKLDYKPGPKARTMGGIATQLAMQPAAILSAVTTGTPGMEGDPHGKKDMPDIAAIVADAEKNFKKLQEGLVSVSDSEWENGRATLTFEGGKWETKKYDMAWGFLFDAIHHRGQLSAYLRGVGAKVPSIYGPSADDRGGM